MNDKPVPICPYCRRETHLFIPVLRLQPLRFHKDDELMYSRDGYHWYYPGEEPVFDRVCPDCAKEASEMPGEQD